MLVVVLAYLPDRYSTELPGYHIIGLFTPRDRASSAESIDQIRQFSIRDAGNEVQPVLPIKITN